MVDEDSPTISALDSDGLRLESDTIDCFCDKYISGRSYYFVQHMT